MRLSELYPSLTREERTALATRAGTDEGYLWQLATQWRGKKPSVDLLSRLAGADSRLTVADMVDEFADARPKHKCGTASEADGAPAGQVA